MKFLLFSLLLLSGCSYYSKSTRNELELKGKSLCACQGGLWYMKYWDTMGVDAHCNNGASFSDIDKLDIVDPGCS
jgi:hypothetical protein